jgi:hypothetical protein
MACGIASYVVSSNASETAGQLDPRERVIPWADEMPIGFQAGPDGAYDGGNTLVKKWSL